MSVLPWPDLIAAAAAQFGLAPASFWALSVCEWRALMGEHAGLDRARLEALCAAFPDDVAPD